MTSSAIRQAAERAYFDRQALSAVATLVDERIVQRYAKAGVWHFNEFMYKVAGPLAGRRVLDVGCGEGRDAIVLARLGAHVTGVDLSAAAIRVAMERLRLNGMTGSFHACAAEDLPDEIEGFDVVWVEAFLHHVLQDLGPILESLKTRMKPGGTIVMAEPVDLVPGLRRLRLTLGPKPEGTPDERPLRSSDVQTIEDVFPSLNTRYFRTLGRVTRFVVPPGALYERLPVTLRLLLDGIALVDAAIGRIPLVRRASSICVFWWQKPLRPGRSVARDVHSR